MFGRFFPCSLHCVAPATVPGIVQMNNANIILHFFFFVNYFFIILNIIPHFKANVKSFLLPNFAKITH